MNCPTLNAATAWPFARDVALCEWCEGPATMKRDWFGHKDMYICEACDEKIEAREGREWERNMSYAERRGWMRARDAGVD